MLAPTPELGRIATTWAAGQAAEWNQWALELWKATEEKRAALVALRAKRPCTKSGDSCAPLGQVH